MTLTPQTPTWNNEYPDKFQVLSETEHYVIIHDPSADKFSPDSEYLLIYKDRNTIESRDRAYVVVLAHMYDAEAMLVMLASKAEITRTFTKESNEKLN